MLKALDVPVPALAAAAPPDEDGRLARARAGDASAFAEIVREHQGMVYSLAYSFLRQTAAAEDLAQDVFLDLYQHAERLTSAAHTRFWLRRVTCHRCIDRLRRPWYRREVALEPLPDRAAPDRGGDMLLEERLGELVAALPPHPRMVVILRYQQDLDLAEIAEALNMPLNTVKSHLRRALASLRTKLSPGDAHES
jgi:RNA polymerase sigma-70 factor (ECF subfamily)